MADIVNRTNAVHVGSMNCSCGKMLTGSESDFTSKRYLVMEFKWVHDGEGSILQTLFDSNVYDSSVALTRKWPRV